LNDERVQRFIAEACFAGVEPMTLRKKMATFGLSDAERALLEASPRRVELYRRLVRNNLLGVTSRMMPNTRRHVNEAAPDQGLHGTFDATFDDFLAERGPRTHYLRDVPAEFLAWVEPRWGADPAVPRYAADLAQFELAHFQVAAAPRAVAPRALANVAPERRLVFMPARKLLRLKHAVHLMPDDTERHFELEPGDVALLVYRDVENTVRVLELTPLAAAMAARLFDGTPLEDAIRGAAEELRMPLTPEVLSSTARMLADWGDRGLLLGADP
jgi:hypothetical protein